MHRLLDAERGSGSPTLRPDGSVCPRSASGLATGFAGVLGAGVSFAALIPRGLPVHLTAIAIIGVTAAAMIAVEALSRRDSGPHSAAIAQAAVRPFNAWRVVRKLVGLAVTLGVVAAAYWLLTEYQRDFYAPFFAAVGVSAPVFLIAAPLYVAYVDRRQRDPEDAYAEIGTFMVTGQAPREFARLRQHCLGWGVKAFFLPLMFVYFCSLLDSTGKTLAAGDFAGLLAWHNVVTDLLFGVDVLIACVGYLFTFRLLGTEIRSVEPTVLGWVACLICYVPFSRVTSAYVPYDEAGYHWNAVLGPWPALQILWGVAILACLVVYVWSTVSFGVRFSNLTNRGIITIGPYRWAKHPAYVSKNISWWLISMPFLTSAGIADAARHSGMLLLFNGVYLLRAITEERHLSRDPDYVAYKAFIARSGLWARLKRIAKHPSLQRSALSQS